jgi:predicted permease
VATLYQEFRQAIRRLLKSPGFTVTAVLTLALGIGSNTAIFSVFNAVVLEPVSFPEPDTLIQLVHTANGEPIDAGASPATYAYWRQQTDVIDDVTVYRSVPANYTGGDRLESVAAMQVSGPYFRTFRAPMAMGRPFADDLSGEPNVTVLSAGFWTRALGSDPNVIGKTLLLNGTPHTVVGVAARELDTRDFGNVDLWTPLDLNADIGSFLKVAARLKPGVALTQAQAQLDTSTTAFKERNPTSLRDEVRFGAVLLEDAVIATGPGTLFRSDPRAVLWVLLGAVAFVLLIACANVSGLMLARASARERDIAVRLALGAGRSRIVRSMLAESVIVSAVGGALGLTIGFVGIRALLAVDTADLPRLGDAGALLGVDWRVVAFTVSVSIATVVLAGLLPALAASRGNPSETIKHSSVSSSVGFRRSKTRSAAVVAQIGLAVVLLIGAALLMRTTVALNAIDPGFNVDHVVVLRTSLPERRFHTSMAFEALSTSTLERIRSIPSVEAAGASCCVPLQRSWGMVFKIIGRDDAGRPFSGGGDVTIGTGDYFDVFELPVFRGRVFDERDDANAPPVVVVNRALADRMWPDGQEPLGQRIRLGRDDEPAREVIGVVENERKARLDTVRPTLYVPLAQLSDAWLTTVLEGDSLAWIVRTSGDPMRVATVLRAQIEQSTGLPVSTASPMKDVVSASISRQRANMLLMTVFGGIALLLAAIGVYGLVAYSVQHRTHEIGIRMALGARRDRILSMVVREGVLLALVGNGVGIVAAYFLATLLSSMLFGVEARSVAVFLAAAVVLTAAVLVAVIVPAYRASRLDPLRALRYE